MQTLTVRPHRQFQIANFTIKIVGSIMIDAPLTNNVLRLPHEPMPDCPFKMDTPYIFHSYQLAE